MVKKQTMRDAVAELDQTQLEHWLKICRMRGYPLPPEFERPSWRRHASAIAALKTVVAREEGPNAWTQRLYDVGIGANGQTGLYASVLSVLDPGMLLRGLMLTQYLVSEHGISPRKVVTDWMHLSGGGQIALWKGSHLIDRFSVGYWSICRLVDSINQRYSQRLDKYAALQIVRDMVSRLPPYGRGFYGYRWFGNDHGALPEITPRLSDAPRASILAYLT